MEVEWLILADSAEVLGNKLYLLGGGWDRININTPLPAEHPAAIAVSVKVPWNETNQRHTLQLEILTDDGSSLGKIDGQFEVGRPPGITPGQEQRIQLALKLAVKITGFGGYFIVARIDGQESRRISFNVVPGLSGPHNPALPPQK